MILKFRNKTGYTISLKNTQTNNFYELLSTANGETFVCSDNVNTFQSTNNYVLIQIVSNEPIIYAASIPMPQGSHAKQELEIIQMEIGIATNGILLTDCSNYDNVPQSNKIVEIGNTYSLPDNLSKDPTSKAMIVGLGKYRSAPEFGLDIIKEDEFYNLKFSNKTDSGYDYITEHILNIYSYTNAKRPIDLANAIGYLVVIFLLIITIISILLVIYIARMRRFGGLYLNKTLKDALHKIDSLEPDKNRKEKNEKEINLDPFNY